MYEPEFYFGFGECNHVFLGNDMGVYMAVANNMLHGSYQGLTSDSHTLSLTYLVGMCELRPT